MPFGMEIGGVRADDAGVRSGGDGDAIHDDGGKMRHPAQQADRQPRNRDPHQRQRQRAQQQPGKKGEARQLLGDLAQIDDQQHQQRRLRQRPQSPDDPAPQMVDRVDAIGAALHRQQRVERRDHGEHHQAMRLARLPPERAQHEIIGGEKGAEQPGHVARQAQRVKAQPHHFLGNCHACAPIIVMCPVGTGGRGLQGGKRRQFPWVVREWGLGVGTEGSGRGLGSGSRARSSDLPTPYCEVITRSRAP